MVIARRWGWWLVAGAAAGLAMLAWLHSRPSTAVTVESRHANASATGWSLLARGGASAERPAQAAASASARMPEALLRTLFTEGSLRGSELDGGWGRWDGQRLLPDAALRRRFDQLLSTVGEASVEELRQLVAWLAERDLGPHGAGAVLEVWDRYLTLQRHNFRETLDLTQFGRWERVLQEHQLVRRELLGPAWAHAFFAEEEEAFRQRLGQTAEAAAPAPSALPAWTDPAPAGTSPETWHSLRTAALGQEAADRLLAAERAQADWDRRLAAARTAVNELARAPELSATQRQAAIQRWLDTHFQGSERLRVGALLGL